MYWQEDEKPGEFRIDEEIVDLLFAVQGRELPVDHAHALSSAILDHVPWLRECENLAIQPIYLAGSQNGWERPDPQLGQRLQLSRRTRMTIRAPGAVKERLREELVGLEIEIEGCSIRLGEPKTRLLARQNIVFSRGIVLEPGEEEDENRFMRRVMGALAERGIRVKKALPGKVQSFAMPEGEVRTRSLLLADLSLPDSLRLQQEGVGPLRHVGCGVFIPHKGIEAVGEAQQEA